MEKAGAQTPTAEADRVKGERKKLEKELAKENASSSGHGPSSKKRGPYKRSGGKRPPVTEAELKALGKTFDDFVACVRVLGDAEATREQKEKVTTDYVISSGRILFLKYAWFLLQYSEEANFAAAAGLWGGYRGKKWMEDRTAAQEQQAKDLFGGLGLGGGGAEEKK